MAQAYAKGAKQLGAKIVEHCAVEGIMTEGEGLQRKVRQCRAGGLPGSHHITERIAARRGFRPENLVLAGLRFRLYRRRCHSVLRLNDLRDPPTDGCFLFSKISRKPLGKLYTGFELERRPEEISLINQRDT